MKKVIILIFVSLNLLGQKKPTDVVDLNNFDILYAETLLHNKFNDELEKLLPEYKPFEKDSVCFKSIEYQLNCNINQNREGHRNVLPFRNVLLKKVSDRVNYFNGKKYYGISIEVLNYNYIPFEFVDTTNKQYYVLDSQYYKEYKDYRFLKTTKLNDDRKYFTYDSVEKKYVHLDDSKVLYNNKITYELIVNSIYEGLMVKSEMHNYYIKEAYKNGLKCFWKIEFRVEDNYINFYGGSVFIE